jgi:SAM-dependent methyltransferase
MTVTPDRVPSAQSVRSSAQGSFRDPGGTLIRYQGRILRAVHPEPAGHLETFLASAPARTALASGKLIPTVAVSREECPPEFECFADAKLFEHEPVAFPSYPYEWPPEMLHAAGRLTLDLAQSVLDAGFRMKDATPYNVLFRGSDPVFVDVLSFERRDPLDAAWAAYAQFVRSFLLPLLVSRHLGIPAAALLAASRDGLEPEAVYRWAGPLQRVRPLFLSLVSIPKWLGGRETAATYKPRALSSPEQARFVLDGILKSCRRQLDALQPESKDSTWSDYLDHKSLYSAEQLAQKEAFVVEALKTACPQTVLDVGANEGHFSLLAARHGASVVAIDSDPAVVGSIWRKAQLEHAPVLPLTVDLTRPTPAIGWRNRECLSFIDRARQKFDLVMMLAVLHHIVVTERVPLEEVFALAGEISRGYVLIEFVAPEDPMFRKIVRGRDDLYSQVTQARFEAAAAQFFDLVRVQRIDGLQRWLYLFHRRRAKN